MNIILIQMGACTVVPHRGGHSMHDMSNEGLSQLNTMHAHFLRVTASVGSVHLFLAVI